MPAEGLCHTKNRYCLLFYFFSSCNYALLSKFERQNLPSSIAPRLSDKFESVPEQSFAK